MYWIPCMGRSLDIIPGLFHQLGQLELHLLLPLTAHSQEGEVHEDHVRTNPNLGMPTLSFLTSVTANRCRLVASIIPFVHILSGDQFFSVLIGCLFHALVKLSTAKYTYWRINKCKLLLRLSMPASSMAVKV